jgi:hypothetical protein
MATTTIKAGYGYKVWDRCGFWDFTRGKQDEGLTEIRIVSGMIEGKRIRDGRLALVSFECVTTTND